jgi:hypothetical protein
MNTAVEALKLAKECGATTYTNRHYPEAAAVTFSPLAWEKFCEQAFAAPAPVQEPVYHLRQFGDVTKEQLDRYMATGDINPQPAQQAVPDAITDIGENPDYRAGWNECRETMLQILKARTL